MIIKKSILQVNHCLFQNIIKYHRLDEKLKDRDFSPPI